jgi:hypothetical protein
MEGSLPAMPRALRIEYPGAAYPVRASGDQGQPIYREDRDHKLWLETLAEARQKKAAQLGGLGKGAAEKGALAWWLRGHTTVRLGWIAGRLEMGHESRVSQAVARMKGRAGRRLKRLGRVLRGVKLEGGERMRCGRNNISRTDPFTTPLVGT